ncbi:hypothetical protein ABT282_33965 [Streptomyces sp. NPDC000927]|uniref:hypothetical protein n=1 Tax=Streptomyces sp. NPDC000927 TaxID=3154371 RepID=UPI003324B462
MADRPEMRTALPRALLFEVLGSGGHTPLPGLRRHPETAGDFRTGESLPCVLGLGQPLRDGHNLLPRRVGAR